MKLFRCIITALLSVAVLFLAGCGNSTEQTEKRLKVGIMLSADGLGDQSFNDTVFQGAIKARDDLNVQVSYKEMKDTETYEAGFEALYKEKNDLIIGVGFETQEALEKVATKYPNQTFIIIDSVSALENVHNVTFKEKEGSFIIGMIAAMKSKSNVVGFIGGMEIDSVKRFEEGFIAGVQSVKPNATILIEYAHTFGDDKKGESIARSMVKKKADILYPAAGFTGYGVLKEAERQGIYAFGVDTDQYYLAEKAVISSMLKKVDVAVYQLIEEYQKTDELNQKDYNLGIKEGAIGIADIRLITLTDAEQQRIDSYIQKVVDAE